MSEHDLGRLFSAQTNVARWRAERENAEARLELARATEARAYLLSQYDPVHALGINREALRVLLAFTVHHDRHRLAREVQALAAFGGTNDS